MIALPATDSLRPREYSRDGHTIHYFPAEGFPMVRLDLLHEAGSAYQPQPLCAAAANRLFPVASADMPADRLAEFMDYRGIIVESDPERLVCRTTFYFLRRYLDELLPVVRGLLERPAFPEADFEAYRSKRRQELQAMQLKSSDVARRLFYQTLFPAGHPLATHAEPDDALRLQLEAVRRFHAEHYTDGHIVLSGQVDDELLEHVASQLGSHGAQPSRLRFALPDADPATRHAAQPIPSSTQTSLRVGRVLPLAWDDPDYARLMILVTLLGGYFGSRLMSSLREDLGLTYGVYARLTTYRGLIVFHIATDVAAGSADQAEEAIVHELRRLAEETIDDDELQRVRTVLTGDFVRSIDGVFERAHRFGQMWAADVDERLTDNLRTALATTTADELRDLAARWLRPEAMVYCRAGA